MRSATKRIYTRRSAITQAFQLSPTSAPDSFVLLSFVSSVRGATAASFCLPEIGFRQMVSLSSYSIQIIKFSDYNVSRFLDCLQPRRYRVYAAGGPPLPVHACLLIALPRLSFHGTYQRSAPLIR